jgi:hypothetical protein
VKFKIEIEKSFLAVKGKIKRSPCITDCASKEVYGDVYYGFNLNANFRRRTIIPIVDLINDSTWRGE